jgi:PAS domain S-box-containing protein
MKRWRAPEYLARGVLSLFAAVILATAVLAMRNATQVQAADAAVTHGWQTLNAIERLVSTIKDVETGQRGYLLTVDPAFLAPYEQAIRQVRQRQEDLLVLVADEPARVEQMKRLQPLVEQRVDEASMVLDIRQESGLEAARIRLLEGRGRQDMAAIRVLAEQMTSDENALLALHLRAVSEARRFAQGATLVVAATGLLLVALAYFLYHREHAVNELALAALKSEGERFRTTLASIGDGVIVTDASGSIEFVNSVARRLTGWGEGVDPVGRVIDEVFRIVSEETRLPVPQPVHGVIDRGVVVGLEDHTVLLARDGTERPIQDSAAPIKDASGVTTGVVLVFRDVTGPREARKQLQRSAEDLREADARKDEFLATLAHELRNPLAPIRVAVQLLRRADTRPEALAEAREVIERQSALLARLVDDFMNAAAIRSGKVALERAEVNIGDVIGRVLEQCRPALDAKHHQLHVSVPEQPINVDGDVHRLTQVVTNLLTNAAKYTPENGDIWLTVGPCAIDGADDFRVEISVRDTGIGITPEMLPRVFDLFVQAPEASRRGGGLGIGLALVKRLLELHGGAVAARSDGVDQGSEFIVTLPCSR